MDLVNSYQLYRGIETVTGVSEFVTRAKKHFGMKEEDVVQYLIFSERSPTCFPLFVALGDTIHISHRTSFLIYIFLHAVLHRDLFMEETVRRSREFEKHEVRKEFERLGWHYYPNLKDKRKSPSLEIDGLAATYERKMLVVECKGWTIRPFYEHKATQDYLIRDLEGIVDGKKYTSGNPERIPSLIHKLEFVRRNMSLWGFDPKDYGTVDGMIVMRGYPPIDEYKGFRILSISELGRYV